MPTPTTPAADHLAPAGDPHGLPAGVESGCHCAPCRRAAARMTDAFESTRYGVPRFRAVRRVQALAAIGYPPAVLAPILAVPVWEVAPFMADDLHNHLSRRLFARLYAAYEVLSARPLLPEANPRWPSPLAWDEPDEPGGLDDPAARPDRVGPMVGYLGPRCATCHHESCNLIPARLHDTVDHARVQRVLAGENVPTTRAEKETVVARWFQLGRTWASLEAQTGWNLESYTKPKATPGPVPPARATTKAGTAA